MILEWLSVILINKIILELFSLILKWFSLILKWFLVDSWVILMILKQFWLILGDSGAIHIYLGAIHIDSQVILSWFLSDSQWFVRVILKQFSLILSDSLAIHIDSQWFSLILKQFSLILAHSQWFSGILMSDSWWLLVILTDLHDSRNSTWLHLLGLLLVVTHEYLALTIKLI